MRYRHNSQLSGNIFDFQSLEGALAYLFTRGTYFYNFLLKVTLSSKTGTLKTKPKYECVGESVGGGGGEGCSMYYLAFNTLLCSEMVMS